MKRHLEEIILAAKYLCFLVSGEFFSCNKIQDFGYGGRATVKAGGLNPSSDLNGCEPFVNKVCEENTF
jgi:hypothetical protein